MDCKIKALGLALMAVLALTAVMAPTASAQFTSSSTHTILSGTQEGNIVFTAGEGFGSIKCTTASFSGTASSTNATSQVITPTYSGCTDSFGRIVHVDNESIMEQTRTGVDGNGTAVGSLHTSGNLTTTITSGGSVVCTIHLITKQSLTGLTYHNFFEGRKITVVFSKVKTTTTGSFFNCGISEGEHTEGTYTGTINMIGKDTAGKAVSISVS
jgi:hypothetical protein